MRPPINDTQSSISIDQATRQAIAFYLSDLNTAMPAKILSVNDDGTVDVLPGNKRVYPDGTQEEYPVIRNVPMGQWGFTYGWLYIPPKKGQTVDLLFNQRAIDAWMDGTGSPVAPNSPEWFGLNGAVAMPIMRPALSTIKPLGAKDSLEIAFKNSRMEITASGKFRMTNGENDVLDVLDGILSALQSATTLTALGPQPLDAATLASLANLQANLATLRP